MCKHNSHARKCQFSKYALKELLKKVACGFADGYTQTRELKINNIHT